MKKPAVDFVRTEDPLLRHPGLQYSTTPVVLGIETVFETNSEYVRELVEETFRAWTTPSGRGPASPTSPQVHVRIVVHEASESAATHAPVRYINAADGRLIIHSPGSVSIVDESRRESLAYVTTAFAADREHFRTTLIEASTFALLACFDRHPIHASAIARDDRAVLLAGPSGMGKSTLAYLAHAAGIGVLGDDRVWVQVDPGLKIWGTPVTARLTAASVQLFPELDGAAQATLDAGKFAVSLAPAVSTASRATVCILERGERAALNRMSPASLSAALLAQLAPGFDRFPTRVNRVLEALTSGGGWRLTLSTDARDALPFLRQMLATD